MSGISDYISAFRTGLFSSKKQLSGLAFIDVEVGIDDKKAHDFGAVRDSGEELHTASKNAFSSFISDAEYLCGHNIIHHDLTYLADIKGVKDKKVIDTLFLSPLLFPKRPYHRLLKDDKLQPLSIFLSRINSGEIGLAFAVAVIYMIPCLLTFLYGEDYLVEGITTQGGVKG